MVKDVYGCLTLFDNAENCSKKNSDSNRKLLAVITLFGQRESRKLFAIYDIHFLFRPMEKKNSDLFKLQITIFEVESTLDGTEIEMEQVGHIHAFLVKSINFSGRHWDHS